MYLRVQCFQSRCLWYGQFALEYFAYLNNNGSIHITTFCLKIIIIRKYHKPMCVLCAGRVCIVQRVHVDISGGGVRSAAHHLPPFWLLSL